MSLSYLSKLIRSFTPLLLSLILAVSPGDRAFLQDYRKYAHAAPNTQQLLVLVASQPQKLLSDGKRFCAERLSGISTSQILQGELDNALVHHESIATAAHSVIVAAISGVHLCPEIE